MVEPIPLTEDILFRKPVSLLSAGIVIMRRSSFNGAGADVILYTVPNNRILFIISASMNQINDGTGLAGNVGGTRLFKGSGSSSNIFLSLAFDDGIAASLVKALDFTVPLRIESNDAITFNRNPRLTAEVAFIGYEVNKEIFK